MTYGTFLFLTFQNCTHFAPIFERCAFLTNAKHLSALDVANLYKKRWLVELFFKWLKQHLKIKRFWGTTENAVRIQISVAIITYCLVAIVQHDMRLERSTYEVLQIPPFIGLYRHRVGTLWNFREK